jgi:DNA repair protein RadC
MQNQNVSFYKPTKFSPNEKGIENYQTSDKETIAFKKIFAGGFFVEGMDDKARSGNLWNEEITGNTLVSQLKEGEFAIVERKYSQIGMFDFTTRGNNKINSHADVAFIFRQLENESIEHAFAVYVDKNSKPSVQWLSMGGINATIIDPRMMVDAAQRLEATKIYLVHNHPSGNLKPSDADKRMVEKLKKAFAPMDINVNAIIINLNSGSYLIFEENSCAAERKGFTSDDFESEQKIDVFSFNKQAFLQSPLKTAIRSPADVAKFLSQQRFSSGEKAGYLLLTTRNDIVGNFFATKNTRNEAFKEVAGLVSKFGGVNVIAYTNNAATDFYNNLRMDLKNLEITLHDVIECESSAYVCQTFEKYKSLAEEGFLNEQSGQRQNNEMNEAGEEKKLPYEKSGQFFYDFPLKPVMVVPLTHQQKSDMAQNPYYEPPHYGFPALSMEQVASVPDVIEGHPLDYQDKLILYESKLEFEGENTSYRINENNAIVKEQNGAKPMIITHADVGFNNFELTKQSFENIHRNNQKPPHDWFQDNNISVKENKTKYIIKKSKIMDTQNTFTEQHLTGEGIEGNNKGTYTRMNLEYLSNQVKYLGFGEGLQQTLSDKMNELNDTIDLPVTQSFFLPGSPVKEQGIDFSLHFSKGKESNMYFFNSYSAQLKGGSEENNLPQKFYINKGKGITAKEAFNLLSGRAINKDFTNKAGETYNAWVKLKPSEIGNEKSNRDFQMYSENYGFNLEKTLSKYPIKEMASPEAAEKLMHSLKKGNAQAVTFTQNNDQTTKFISANPQFKNLNVLNHDGSVMFHNSITLNKSNADQKKNVETKPAETPVMKVVKPSRMKR